jgi:hypothetical protein
MDVPVDFTNMTPEQIADATETNFINDAKRAGLSNSQIKDFINNAGGSSIFTPTAVSTPVTDGGAVNVTAQNTPSLSNVLSTIASTTPTVNVSAPKTQVDQATLNLINSQLASNVKTPANLANVEVTGNRPATTQEVINAITASLPSVPSVNVPTQTVTAQKPTSVGDTLATLPSTLVSTPTTTATTTTKETDPVKVAQLALSAAGLLGAGAALSNTNTPTGFEVVPIPEGWKNPPAPSVAPFTQLPPINFGDRNLLIGTQWEKFLDPNYGQVPAPVQYSQPSNLSYNDLMGILGNKQGMPSASSLSINDIISGIQNQYGQAPARTMG